jgi:hypothetical protein
MPIMYETVEKEMAAMAAKARANGLWFHSVHTKEWLTPEEFVDLGKVNQIKYGDKDRSVLIGYYMSDPRDGMRKRMAYLQAASSELQQFSEKIFGYFNQVAKDK